MRRIAAFIIRSSAFVTKELAEILRQTRLLLALVLGPFLILLVFGLGFRNQARVLRTVFVVPNNESVIRQQVEQYATSLGPQLDFRGVTDNKSEALAQLSRGQVDAVAVIPSNTEQQIRNSEQPTVQLFHREIDPLQVSYVEYVGQIYVDELNRRVLRNIAEQGQQEAGSVQQDMDVAKASARAMREAYQTGNAQQAQAERNRMKMSLDAVSLAVGASLGVLSGVEETVGADQGGSGASVILGTLNHINQTNQSLQAAAADKSDYSQEAQRSTEIESDLDQLDTQLKNFRQIDPRVLVSPFKSETLSVNNVKLETSEFFSPGVIILLLQHLLVTFASLSIVRERISGAMELFRVSPLSPFETLLGKYISYMLIGVVLAAAISALVVLVLSVPMLGSWQNFAIVLTALMFTSLGMGFVISLLSETTSQAVQYSMLTLLFSIFFSGFFLDLRLMDQSVRFLAYIIPATFGMRLLQEVMFRANAVNIPLLAGLLGIGVLFFILSLFLLARQMRTR